jgi:UDP-N-acetylmuramate dehydrogenase
MPGIQETLARLAEIPNVHVSAGEPLAAHTRFGIGGPADFYAETARVDSFLEALNIARGGGLECAVIGSGTNLVVSDEGFRGVVLRFTGDKIEIRRQGLMAEAGAELQSVVEAANGHDRAGLETLAGIPGSVGGAIYGNAGAYGRAISEVASEVYFFDGAMVRALDHAGCQFAYRESIFKRRKDWVILTVEVSLEPGDPEDLRRRSEEILAVRQKKYPPEMRCAGSIFKNLLWRALPPDVREQVPAELVREGKVPAAWFLDQAGCKGLTQGDMQVPDYHANLIYNAGAGTARDLCALIAELKGRVRERFGLELEEEVQYLGFGKSGVRSQESEEWS